MSNFIKAILNKLLKTKNMKLSKTNERFWAMSADQKRVAIAKDVIKQLETQFYQASAGTYFMMQLESPISINKTPKLDDLFSRAKKEKGVCSVCAIGACFTSAIRLGNKFKTDVVFDDDDGAVHWGSSINSEAMKTRLSRFFSDKQLSLIECAFEKSYSYNRNISTDLEDRIRASKFGAMESNDHKRMIAIMKNIIKNKGTFIP